MCCEEEDCADETGKCKQAGSGMNLKSGDGLADRLPALDRMAVEPGQTCEEDNHNNKCSGHGAHSPKGGKHTTRGEHDSYNQLFGKQCAKLDMGVDAREIGNAG